MTATARCTAFVVTVGLLGAAPALAQDTVSPQRMGEFLGFVLMCGCLPYESSHQAAAFYALMVEEEGERYADTAAGYMRRIQNGSYRNTATVCSGYVCRNDYTVYLGEILAMIDLETEPDVFMEAYETEYRADGDGSEGKKTLDDLLERDSSDRWSSTTCRVSPARPECRTTGE